MVSFEVKFLFTSVPLEYSIDIIIKQIFEDHEITTIFTRSEIKKLYALRTYTSHLTMIFISKLTELPLGPVIANTFMVELETTLVPKLEDHAQKRIRFVDDTFAFVKIGSNQYIFSVLNSFYKNI